MGKLFGTITMVRIEELDAEAPTSSLYGVWNTPYPPVPGSDGRTSQFSFF